MRRTVGMLFGVLGGVLWGTSPLGAVAVVLLGWILSVVNARAEHRLFRAIPWIVFGVAAFWLRGAWQTETVVTEGNRVEQVVMTKLARVRLDRYQQEGVSFPAGERVMTRYRRKSGPYLPGDVVRVDGNTRGWSAPSHPWDFDGRRYWGSRGIGGRIFLIRHRWMAVEERGGWGWKRVIARARWRVQEGISESDLPEEIKGPLLALALGDGGAMEAGQREVFSATGTAHLFAVSGLHVAGLAGAMVWLLGWLLSVCRVGWGWAWGGRWVLAIALGGVVVVYTDTGYSGVRALVMLSGYAFCRGTGRDYDIWSWLAATGAMALLIRPEVLWEAGFQLSNSAVVGIVVGLKLVHRVKRVGPSGETVWEGWTGWFRSLLWVSLFAALATLPATWFHFGVLPLPSVVCNAFAVPMVSFLLLPLVVLWVIVVSLGGAFHSTLLHLAAHVVRLMLPGLHWITEVIPFAWAPWPGLLWAVALVAAAFVAVVPGGWRRRVCGVLGLVVVALFMPSASSGGSGNEVVFLDVGEGDGALIRTRCGDVVAVDAGPGSAAWWVWARALRYYGVRRIDVWILTHGHEDHYGALLPLAHRLPICEIRVPPDSAGMEIARTVQQMNPGCDGHPTFLHSTVQGDLFSVCGMSVETVWPPEGLEGVSENNRSVVTLLREKGFSLLLAGDVEGWGGEMEFLGGDRGGPGGRRRARESWNELLLAMTRDSGVESGVRWCKVPHHGRRSEGLLPLLQSFGCDRLIVPSRGKHVWWRGWALWKNADPWGIFLPILVTGECGMVPLELP